MAGMVIGSCSGPMVDIVGCCKGVDDEDKKRRSG